MTLIPRRPKPVPVPPELPVCIDKDCSRTDIRARGMCPLHYDHWYVEMKTGVPVKTRPPRGVNQCEADKDCSDVASVRADGRISCRKHEGRWIRHGNYEKMPTGRLKTGISFKGLCPIVLPDGRPCPNEARQFDGLCENHYKRTRLYGDPQLTKREPVLDMTVENLLAKTVKGNAEEQTLDCDLWTGRLTPDGYAYDYDPALHRAGKPATKFIHRRIYQLIHGEDSVEGWTIDHRCHDPNRCKGGDTCPHRRCINPDHLVLETRGNNARRHSPIQRELSMLNVTDPSEAVSLIMGKLRKPCGHFWPKYGPSCTPDTCDQTKGEVA